MRRATEGQRAVPHAVRPPRQPETGRVGVGKPEAASRTRGPRDLWQTRPEGRPRAGVGVGVRVSTPTLTFVRDVSGVIA